MVCLLLERYSRSLGLMLHRQPRPPVRLAPVVCLTRPVSIQMQSHMLSSAWYGLVQWHIHPLRLRWLSEGGKCLWQWLRCPQWWLGCEGVAVWSTVLCLLLQRDLRPLVWLEGVSESLRNPQPGYFRGPRGNRRQQRRLVPIHRGRVELMRPARHWLRLWLE